MLCVFVLSWLCFAFLLLTFDCLQFKAGYTPFKRRFEIAVIIIITFYLFWFFFLLFFFFFFSFSCDLSVFHDVFGAELGGVVACRVQLDMVSCSVADASNVCCSRGGHRLCQRRLSLDVRHMVRPLFVCVCVRFFFFFFKKNFFFQGVVLTLLSLVPLSFGRSENIMLILLPCAITTLSKRTLMHRSFLWHSTRICSAFMDSTVCRCLIRHFTRLRCLEECMPRLQTSFTSGVICLQRQGGFRGCRTGGLSCQSVITHCITSHRSTRIIA